MLSKKIEDALNEQINAEFWSGYLYLSMSCHFADKGLDGVANWFRIQFQEEQAHALALLDYLHARGGKVVLSSIADVPTSWESLKDAFTATYDHERKVTRMINNLYGLAEEEKDYATRQKLNGFVAEQVEEEENVTHIIDSLNLIGEDGAGLYQFDLQMAQRKYNAPNL
ncbi:MAG: ferritin [Muribaculaceae bacterium]|nr:ferritin [Muribaculaceae bacterium]